MNYWVLRRDIRDTDSGGNFRSMQRCAGPFSTEREAWAEAQKRINANQGLHKFDIDYRAMSDDELEEARRRGIRIY